jgi:hypothetical protein
MAMSGICKGCGVGYEGPRRAHLAAVGHARSRSSRPAHAAFLEAVVRRPDSTVASIGDEYGLRHEAPKRAAWKAGLFRRGRRPITESRDNAVVHRAPAAPSRRALADEFGLSLSHVYFILRVARARSVER